MVSKRRRLRALHVLEPLEVLGRKLSEGDATAAAFLSVALKHDLLGDAGPDEARAADIGP